MPSTKLERPGVVAAALSALAFDYSLLPPMYSLGAEPAELPRLVIFWCQPCSRAIALRVTWNWQEPDWPTFRWDRTRLEAAEKQFLVSGGVFVGTARHLEKEERDQLTIEAMSMEAVTTSEIEG